MALIARLRDVVVTRLRVRATIRDETGLYPGSAAFGSSRAELA